MKQKGEIALWSSQCKEMSEEMSKTRIDLEGVAKELNEEKEQMPSKIRSELQPLKDDLALQLKATKEECDKRIEALSENIKAKESKLSREITRLSKENEELQSKLKATKEESWYYGNLFENVKEIYEQHEKKEEVSPPLALTLTRQSLSLT